MEVFSHVCKMPTLNGRTFNQNIKWSNGCKMKNKQLPKNYILLSNMLD